MTRDELIAALERATGPDTDLDMGCWAVTRGMEFERRPDGRIRALVVRCYCTGRDHPHWVGYGEKERPHPYPGDNSIWGVPHYTGSFDAAMTLVPDGGAAGPWLPYIERRMVRGHLWWRVALGHYVYDAVDPVEHAILSIALCIAALKAMETDHE